MRRAAPSHSAQQDGSTALIAAVYNEQAEAAALLLGAGADVAAQSDDGDTALMFACMRGSAPLIELLLDAGADVNAANKARACSPGLNLPCVSLELTRRCLGRWGAPR